MATTEGPSSPQRIKKQSEFVKPPGFDAMGLREQLKALGVSYKHMKGESEYETEKCMRVARNKAIMEKMGVTTAAQDLRIANLMAKPREARRAPVRRNMVPASDIQPRRCERHDGKKRNYVEVGERYQWEERRSRAKMPRLNREGRPRMVQLKQVFAIQSDFAIGRAADAAEAKANEAEDGRAYAKRMEPSNVGGGFWQQLPARMQQTWPFKQKTGIEIECDEVSRKHSAIKKERGLATWEFQKGENERRWPTIWLPRGDNGRDGAPRSAGLSGGWRGFALDHELTPNDCVVWEVPADVPFGKLPTYIKVFLFRAEDYETEESSKYVVTYAEEQEKQLKSCEPLDKELEEAGKGADEEGAEASKAAVEGAPMMEAAGKAGPSQAPVSAPKGKKAAAAARVSRTDEAAAILEAMKGCQADASVVDKAVKKKNKADKAVPAKEAKKSKRAASAAKEVAKKKEATTKAAASPAKKPRTHSRRTRKPSAVVVNLAQRRWEEEQERLNKLAAVGVASKENFDVEVILDTMDLKTTDPRFKVRWMGFGPEDDTWEPYSMFEDDIFQYAWADKQIKAEAQKLAKKWSK